MSQDPFNCIKKFTNFNDLLVRLSEENDYYKKSKILHTFFKEDCSTKFFDADANSECYLEVISEVSNLCEIFLKLIPYDSNSITEKNIDFERKTQYIEGASLCFDVIHKLLESCNEKVLHLQTIKITLNMLSLGYTHCQDSELIYGETLEHLENQLGLFFMKIENLQTISLKILDIYNNTASDITEESILTSLLSDLGNVCQLVSTIHASSAFNLWKCYTKFLSNHTHLEKFDISSAVTCLVSQNLEILQMNKCNLNTETEEDEETSTNFCFYLDILVDVLKFSQNECEENIFELQIFITNLFEFLIMCFSPIAFDKSCLTKMKSCLIKNTFFVLSNLYRMVGCVNLMELEQADPNSSTMEYKESQIGLLLTFLCATQFMESSPVQQKEQMFFKILPLLYENKLENDGDLLYARVPQCTVMETNSDKFFTIYEFAYEQMCKFLKTFPSELIQKMNNSVLIKSGQCSNIGFLLLSDVWIYRLRCESLNFLEDLFRSALKVCAIGDIHINTENFLKRILNFFPDHYEEKLCEEFPTLRFLYDTEIVQHRYGTPDLCSSEDEFSIHSHQNMEEKMSILKEYHTNDVLQLIQKAFLWLELCATHANTFTTMEIYQLIEFMCKMFKTEIYEIQIAVLTCIKALSRKELQEHSEEFRKIPSNMAELFSLAIHSRNYMVQLEALNTFNYFANRTPHVSIVLNTLKHDPTLKPILKNYMSLGQETFLNEKEKMEILQQEMPDYSENIFEISESSKQALLEIFSKDLAFL